MKEQSVINKGISAIEIIVALAVLSLSISSTMALSFTLHKSTNGKSVTREIVHIAHSELFHTLVEHPYFDFKEEEISTSTLNFTGTSSVKLVDAYTKEFRNALNSIYGREINFSFLMYDYENIVGGETCFISNKSKWNTPQISGSFIMDQNNSATDLFVRNGIVYLSADSATQGMEDMYILDTRNTKNTDVVSKLHTGPGIQAITHASHYIFAANMSGNAQLQVIDIIDRSYPHVVSSLKLPHPDASTTPGIPQSILFNKDKIYMGTNKNTGREFHIIDVKDPLHPVYLNGLETDTVVHSIYVRGPYAYIATANKSQLRVIDIESNPLQEVGVVDLPGWQTQEGKLVYPYRGELYLGRGVGGFNNIFNHELISFSLNQTPDLDALESKDIAASVNGIVVREPYVFIGSTHSLKEFEVLDMSDLSVISSIDFPGRVVAMRCDGEKIYAVLDHSQVLKIIEKEL